MDQLKDVLKYKKEWIYLGAFVFTIILIEVLVFNRGNVFSNPSRLEERHYSIKDGALHQFDLENGSLVAENNDPNLTIDNINLPIDSISIYCNNSIPGALGQVFYRNRNESFTELHSISYDPSSPDKTYKLPEVGTVSSLRFDLTNIPGDSITCSEFVLYPHTPPKLNLSRLIIYVGLLLLSILYIFRNSKPIHTFLHMIRRNEGLIFLSIFSILVLFRIWLITGIPKLLVYAPHDDLYFAQMAYYIIHGQWMGPYSHMTLLKGPFYAFFMILSSFTGLPLLLNETLFYVGACIVLYFAFSPLIKNRWWRLILFTPILYCPASLAILWNIRVYREFVYFSLTLYVVAFSIGLFLRLDEKIPTLLTWLIGLGLSIGAFMITREEGIWIYPTLIFLLAICIILLWKKKIERKWIRSGLILATIFLWYIPTFIVSYLNYSYYGFWGISENLDMDFNRVLITLGRIKTDTWYPFIQITKEARRKAYKASPILNEMKDTIENAVVAWNIHDDPAMQLKPDWYLSQYSDGGSELDGHFLQLLSAVVYDKGYYAAGKYPHEFYKQLADQLEAACNDGKLDCSPPKKIPIFFAQFEQRDYPIILRMFFEYIIQFLNLDYIEIPTLDMYRLAAYNDTFKYFEEFVYNPLDIQRISSEEYDQYFINEKMDLRLKTLIYKDEMMEKITPIYRGFTLPVFGAGFIAWVFLMVLSLPKNRRGANEPYLVISIFLMGLFFSRFTLLIIMDATSAASAMKYWNSNYLFIYVFSFLMLYWTFKQCTKVISQHAIKN